MISYSTLAGAFSLGSVSHTIIDYALGKLDPRDEAEISSAAKSLVDQYGNEADIVAARRADVLLGDGNTAEGTKWLKIFRWIATLSLSPRKDDHRGA